MGENATDVHVSQWLTETPVYTDAIEILSEKARRFWWAQQIDLGMVSWSMLLAIEGRRRNIPLLWSYQLLGQLVSLSYAQNLFFIALLLTPAPLTRRDDDSLPLSRFEDSSLHVSDRKLTNFRYVRIRNAIFPPKPANWAPHPMLYVAILVPRFAAVALSTIVANTPSFNTVYVAGRALTLAPLVLPYIVPESWGKVHSEPHEIYGTYGKLFKSIAVASFALHAKATLTGLAYNAPDAHFHRHSIHLPFDTETRSSWERTTSAFGRILEATSDHPVVMGVGWDVLLSTLSIGLWAAVRSTDVSGLLASTLPFYERESIKSDNSTPEPTKNTGTKAITTGTSSDEPTTPRRRGRPRKVKDEDQAYEPTPSEAADLAEGDVLPESGETGWDSTAVAWGLSVLGGLGLGSAGVFGGECVAR